VVVGVVVDTPVEEVLAVSVPELAYQ